MIASKLKIYNFDGVVLVAVADVVVIVVIIKKIGVATKSNWIMLSLNGWQQKRSLNENALLTPTQAKIFQRFHQRNKRNRVLEMHCKPIIAYHSSQLAVKSLLSNLKEKNERRFNKKNALATSLHKIENYKHIQTIQCHWKTTHSQKFLANGIGLTKSDWELRIVENGALLSSFAFVCINCLLTSYAFDHKRKVGSQSIQKLYTKSKWVSRSFSCILLLSVGMWVTSYQSPLTTILYKII